MLQERYVSYIYHLIIRIEQLNVSQGLQKFKNRNAR